MKLRTSAAAIALVATPFAPAFAGNLAEPVVEPAPVVTQAAPVYTFAGGYVGAQLGWGWADTDTTDLNPEDQDVIDFIGDTPQNIEDAVRGIGEDGDGVTGGINAGYLWQNNNLVYGGEVAYDWTDIEFDDGSGDFNGFASLKGKLGYSFGRTLVYGTAGAVYGDAKLLNDDYNDWGWAAGAGIEYLVTESISVGAEALYTDYAEFDDSNIDVSVTTLQARLAYRF